MQFLVELSAQPRHACLPEDMEWKLKELPTIKRKFTTSKMEKEANFSLPCTPLVASADWMLPTPGPQEEEITTLQWLMKRTNWTYYATMRGTRSIFSHNLTKEVLCHQLKISIMHEDEGGVTFSKTRNVSCMRWVEWVYAKKILLGETTNSY